MSETETTSAQTESTSDNTTEGQPASGENKTATKTSTAAKTGDQSDSEPQGNDDDKGAATDWKSEARKHEGRAKASKAAADRAATEKAEAESAREAAEKSQRELMDNLAKALGFKRDDAPLDPEALQRAITERDGKIQQVEQDRDQQVQALTDKLRNSERLLAVMYHAADPALGANVRALWDSKQFEKSVSGLDHEADTFAKDAVTAIKAAIEGNEAYRINRVASASDAGIGATGAKGNDAAAAAPGAARLRAAYASTTH